jgi:hypothetical protein
MMLGYGQKNYYGYLYGYFQEDNNYPVKIFWKNKIKKNLLKENNLNLSYYLFYRKE